MNNQNNCYVFNKNYDNHGDNEFKVMIEIVLVIIYFKN